MKTITRTITSLFSGSSNKILLGAIVGMFITYSFFIAKTVVAINERKMLYNDLREEQMVVADLETRYFNLAAQIDMTKVATFGFNNLETPRFAYVETSGQDTVALAH